MLYRIQSKKDKETEKMKKGISLIFVLILLLCYLLVNNLSALFGREDDMVFTIPFRMC